MYLKRGDKGPEVARVQNLLNAALDSARFYEKYKNKIPLTWSHLNIDSDFGPLTENAAKAFQLMLDIKPVSGEIGDTTYRYLESFSPSISMLRGEPQKNIEFSPLLRDAIKEAISGFPAFFLEWINGEKLNWFTSDKNNQIKKNELITKNVNELNRLRKSFYIKLTSFMKGQNAKLQKASDLLEQYKTKSLKKNEGSRKYKKYNKNIDKILSDTFKSYKKTQLDPNQIVKHFKVGKVIGVLGAWVGKCANWADAALSFAPLIMDLENATETKEWHQIWNKDFGNFVTKIISIIGAAIIGALLIPEEAAFLVAALISMLIAGAINFILSLLRKTTWGRHLETTIGNLAYESLKNFEEWADSEYKKGSPIFTPGFSAPYYKI